MKKIIRLNESDIVRIVKRILKEQAIVSGPYKPLGRVTLGDLYILKTDKVMCMNKTNNETIVATNNVCPSGYITIPANKFFVSGEKRNTDNSLMIMPTSQGEYVLGTNNGQGYNSEEEAKKAISKIINPEGFKGRQVEKTPTGKTVTKYSREGDLKSVKQNINYTNPQGQQSTLKSKTSSGL